MRKIKITGGFALLMSALYLLDNGGMLSALILSALVHELGHVAAIKLCGGKISGLTMDVTGFKIDFNPAGLTYGAEIIIALAGPCLNLILAYFSSWAGNRMGSEFLLLLSGLNLILCVFNLLPIRQFDGGRALFMLLAMLFNIDLAERTLCILSCGAIFLMMIGGAYLLIVSGRNFTWLTVSVWLLVSYCKRRGNGIEY